MVEIQKHIVSFFTIATGRKNPGGDKKFSLKWKSKS
jgi:hypothetical protein